MTVARCNTCGHSSRGAIDSALVAGESHRVIAARFGLAKASITRHAAHSKGVTAAKQRVEAAHERTILAEVQALAACTQKALEAGIAAALVLKVPTMSPLDATRELGRLLELEAKLTGAFAPKRVELSQAPEDPKVRLARLKSVVAALESAEDPE